MSVGDADEKRKSVGNVWWALVDRVRFENAPPPLYLHTLATAEDVSVCN